MTTHHRAEAQRLLREAETTYREGLRAAPARPKQIAFGEEPADRSMRAAALLTAMAHAHATLATPATAPAAAGGQVWLAARTGIPLGYYTARQAAAEHCEDDARTVQGLSGDLSWACDEDEPDDRQELDVATADGTASTGYTITAITPADTYDPEEEL